MVEMDTHLRRLAPTELDEPTTSALYAFHSRFVHRSRASFEAGLRKVDEIWLLEDAARAVLAFATVESVSVEVDGEEHLALYTRWAFVDPAHRRRGFVQRVGLSAWLRARFTRPLRPIYWVFTASTLDSYLHMLRTARAAFPNRNAATPPHLQEILRKTHAALGTEGWDPEAGVVRRAGEVQYRTGLVDERTIDPDAAFYRERNPHQSRGDSLGCIAVADLGNLAFYARRALEKSLGRLGVQLGTASAGAT